MDLYKLPPDPHVGERAKKLRLELGLSPAQVAERADIHEDEVVEFERTGNGCVQAMFAIHRVVSCEADLARLFTLPRFETLADVIAFGQRRLTRHEQEGLSSSGGS